MKQEWKGLKGRYELGIGTINAIVLSVSKYEEYQVIQTTYANPHAEDGRGWWITEIEAYSSRTGAFIRVKSIEDGMEWCEERATNPELN